VTRTPEAPSYQRPQLRVRRWRAGEPRIVVAHELRILAPALRVALAGRVQVVSQTMFGAAAVALSEILTPDVIVAGDLLSDGLIEQFLPGLLRTGARVVVVTHDADTDRGLRLLRQGVSGLLSPRVSVDDTAEAVIRVSRGEAVVAGPLTETLLREWRGAATSVGAVASGLLTRRELDVLAAMADGLGTKAVARRLGIAGKTAENYKTRVFQKLGVRSQAEAIALIQGHVPPPRFSSPLTVGDADAPGLRLA
jgi:DNA-binding NarL/FixJ family response regulator